MPTWNFAMTKRTFPIVLKTHFVERTCSTFGCRLSHASRLDTEALMGKIDLSDFRELMSALKTWTLVLPSLEFDAGKPHQIQGMEAPMSMS